VDQPHLALSPTGKWMAAGTSCFVSLFDLATGKKVRVWKLKDIETITQMQFNVSGELLVTTRTPRIQRCYVIDVTRESLPQPQLFPFVGMLFLDPTGEVLVKMREPLDERARWSADLLRRSNQQLLRQVRAVPSPDLLKIAPGGKTLAFGNVVIDSRDRIYARSARDCVHAAKRNVATDLGAGLADCNAVFAPLVQRAVHRRVATHRSADRQNHGENVAAARADAAPSRAPGECCGGPLQSRPSFSHLERAAGEMKWPARSTRILRSQSLPQPLAGNRSAAYELQRATHQSAAFFAAHPLGPDDPRGDCFGSFVFSAVGSG
jgi:hypothetical protein